MEGKHSHRNEMRSKAKEMILNSQSEVVKALQALETDSSFQIDDWTKGKRYGRSCVLQKGAVLEKAAVMFSSFDGEIPVKMSHLLSSTSGISERKRELKATEGTVPFFFAAYTGAVHPVNPHIPSYQFSLRYCELEDCDGTVYRWFGGNTDLIPAVLHEQDVTDYHRNLKQLCDKHNADYYNEFKQLADKCFLIKHRGETRGVGGLVFDDLDIINDEEEVVMFAKEFSSTIIDLYIPIAKEHIQDGFSEAQRDWQYHRRSRFVEYNLLYDNGTVPWLPNPGVNAEGILVSLPPKASWTYHLKVEPGSDEERLQDILKHPKDWIA